MDFFEEPKKWGLLVFNRNCLHPFLEQSTPGLFGDHPLQLWLPCDCSQILPSQFSYKIITHSLVASTATCLVLLFLCFVMLNIVLYTQLLTPSFTYCRSNRFDRIIMGPKKGASALKTIEYPPDCKEVSTELSKDELHRRLKVCYLC